MNCTKHSYTDPDCIPTPSQAGKRLNLIKSLNSRIQRPRDVTNQPIYGWKGKQSKSSATVTVGQASW